MMSGQDMSQEIKSTLSRRRNHHNFVQLKKKKIKKNNQGRTISFSINIIEVGKNKQEENFF